MTYSILLVVKRPSGENYKHTEAYEQCVYRLGNLSKQNKDIQLLGENTVLLPLSRGLLGVSDVVRAIQSLSYTYTILNEETKWHEAMHKA